MQDDDKAHRLRKEHEDLCASALTWHPDRRGSTGWVEYGRAQGVEIAAQTLGIDLGEPIHVRSADRSAEDLKWTSKADDARGDPPERMPQALGFWIGLIFGALLASALAAVYTM